MWTRCGHCKLFGTGCILSRALRTKETLPDFREWCRVTRHPRVFRGLMDCQLTPEIWGVTDLSIIMVDHKKAWKQYGCSIMSEGWTDGKSRCLINFLVNSYAGTWFMKSIDASNIIKKKGGN